MSNPTTVSPSTIILKIGGSILTGEADIAAAVHEIYRWVRRGQKVIAVVSALHGATDRLLARAKKYGDDPNESAVAALVATGELTSASLIGLALDRSGIPAEVLDAGAIGLRSEGPRLDSTPTAVCLRSIQAALDRVPVLVIPGFIARDEQGHTTLLGRGGSDLTALFLAHKLGARCRLIKDVPGIFDRDPKSQDQAARRFTQLTWDDLATIGGKVVQPKAAAFAREHRVTFEVAAILHEEATLIGAAESVLAEQPVPSSRPLRVALLGHGTVGAGVAKAIRRQPERFKLVAVAVKNPDKPGHAAVPKKLITTDTFATATGEADVVIEAIGGIEPPRRLIEAALLAGKHVITANKAVLSQHGADLSRLAARQGVRLLYSAAVGGSVPVIETVRASRSKVRSIQAVLNGTSNFILDKTGDGVPFEAALAEAQAKGLAEADPSRDLDGRDAQDKLLVLAHEAWDSSPTTIRREPLFPHAAAPTSRETTLRQVATLTRCAKGVSLSVIPEALPQSHPLAQVRRENNAALISFEDGSQKLISGKGAGRWPTTEAVFADLLDIHHEARNENARPQDRAFLNQELELSRAAVA